MKRLPRIALVCIFLLQLSSIGFAQSGIITTYVGPQMPVNGAQATTQAIDNPVSIAPDGTGGFYVTSYFQQIIYRVTANGTLNIVAGNGIQGFSGDGGPAISARLDRPWGLAVDTSGNLYIADGGNNRVRQVSANGIIRTVAGGGTNELGDGGTATAAQLGMPVGVTVGTSGNLYIADTSNKRIRQVSANGIISTIAGNGMAGINGSGDGGPATSAQLVDPYGVAEDASGNLYIVDVGDNRIRQVSTNGIIRTVAGGGTAGLGDGGPAAAAQLFMPLGMAVDPAGNLYIAESNLKRIRLVSTNGIISPVAGNGNWGFSGDGGPAIAAQLSNPAGIALDAAGNLYIADRNNNRIRLVSTNGIIRTVAGNGTSGFSGDGGPAAAARSLSEY
jgi:trimeric autotransporter adhesin